MSIRAVADAYFERYRHKHIAELAPYLAEQAVYEDSLEYFAGKQELLTGLAAYFENIGHLNYRVSRSFVSGKFVMYQGMVAFQFSEAQFEGEARLFDYLTAFGVSIKVEHDKVVHHIDFIDMQAFDRQRESQLAHGAGRPAVVSHDAEAEVRAVLNTYIDGIYNCDPVAIERSVRPDLFKLGYELQAGGYYREERMTYQGLLQFVTSFSDHPEQPRREITVYEVNQQTACAKIEFWWGVDYMLLARLDGKWRVVEVLWQDRPEYK